MTNVPAKLNCRFAMKSITDEYTQQWVITIYRELRNYNNVKQAINLWIKKKKKLCLSSNSERNATSDTLLVCDIRTVFLLKFMLFFPLNIVRVCSRIEQVEILGFGALNIAVLKSYL